MPVIENHESLFFIFLKGFSFLLLHEAVTSECNRPLISVVWCKQIFKVCSVCEISKHYDFKLFSFHPWQDALACGSRRCILSSCLILTSPIHISIYWLYGIYSVHKARHLALQEGECACAWQHAVGQIFEIDLYIITWQHSGKQSLNIYTYKTYMKRSLYASRWGKQGSWS